MVFPVLVLAVIDIAQAEPINPNKRYILSATTGMYHMILLIKMKVMKWKYDQTKRAIYTPEMFATTLSRSKCLKRQKDTGNINCPSMPFKH